MWDILLIKKNRNIAAHIKLLWPFVISDVVFVTCSADVDIGDIVTIDHFV